MTIKYSLLDSVISTQTLQCRIIFFSNIVEFWDVQVYEIPNLTKSRLLKFILTNESTEYGM